MAAVVMHMPRPAPLKSLRLAPRSSPPRVAPAVAMPRMQSSSSIASAPAALLPAPVVSTAAATTTTTTSNSSATTTQTSTTCRTTPAYINHSTSGPGASMDSPKLMRRYSAPPAPTAGSSGQVQGSGATSPPRRVRFADDCGVSLERCVLFYRWDEPWRCSPKGRPPSPVSAVLVPGGEELDFCRQKDAVRPHMFLDSGSVPQRDQLVRIVAERNVGLEDVTVRLPTIFITVRVTNIAPIKQVTIRYTTDNWATTMEADASYLPGGCERGQERFVLGLPLYNFSLIHTLQFCICYRAGGQEHWDNNNGANYVLRSNNNSAGTAVCAKDEEHGSLNNFRSSTPLSLNAGSIPVFL